MQGKNVKRRPQIFQHKKKEFGIDTSLDPTIAGHVITEYDDELGLKLISALDDRSQFFVSDEPVVDVNVGQYNDTQTIERLRPVIDLNCLLVNYKPARLDQEAPKRNAGEEQR